MDAVLQALSDPSRRRMLDALREGEATVTELAALVPIARPGVSRHLRVLREAGLVELRQEAQWRVYRLRPEPMAEVDAWLGRYRSLWEQRFHALHTEVARGKRAGRAGTRGPTGASAADTGDGPRTTTGDLSEETRNAT
jgi:DNA-binding transcriptional ArsR family regulator